MENKVTVPYVHLEIGESDYKKELLAAVDRVLSHGKYILGPEVELFEQKFAEYSGTKYALGVDNGTNALILSLLALGIGPGDEVITAPNSFLASASSIALVGAKPVFADVRDDLNLNPEKIEAAITSKTTAILPVHIYGNPCRVERIQEIANQYGLKVIYDAAHAFGVNYNGQNICNYGDLSVLSFHATKVFNTMEGGAIVCHDANTKKQIDFLKNFGFASEIEVKASGINSKMNEMQAALGLLQLKQHNANIEKRKTISQAYKTKIEEIKGISFLPEPENTDSNYAYFPIFVDEKEFGISRDLLYEKLKVRGVYGRRYFYPLISEFSMYKDFYSARSENLLNAKEISQKVICLPIYPDLEMQYVDFIVSCISDIRLNSNE